MNNQTLKLPYIEKIRLLTKLNKTEFARRIGLARVCYYKMLWGHITPSKERCEIISRLAAEFGMGINKTDLLNETVFLHKKRKSLT
jgi:hypothetical protein